MYSIFHPSILNIEHASGTTPIYLLFHVYISLSLSVRNVVLFFRIKSFLAP